MKILLIVSCSNDVFIYNFAKNLKAKLSGVIIDVFERNAAVSSNQGCDNRFYDSVTALDTKAWFFKYRVIRTLIQQFIFAHQLDNYLKRNTYDVIQVHYVMDYVTLSSEMRKTLAKVFLSFWGGELRNEHILFSHRLYKIQLSKLVKHITGIICTRDTHFKTLFPKAQFFHGSLGSAPTDIIYRLLATVSKDDAKRCFTIPTDKVSVLIGYSGKPIHQHIEIIREFEKVKSLSSKVHFIAPMIRGASSKYIERVKTALDNSGYSYSLFADHFFNDEEMALLRIATDVTFQFSTFDAYSRSIVECLCAKSLLVYGEWLEYEQYLDRDGFFAIKVRTIRDGITALSDFIYKPAIYKQSLSKNRIAGEGLYAWSNCINDWIKAYIYEG